MLKRTYVTAPEHLMPLSLFQMTKEEYYYFVDVHMVNYDYLVSMITDMAAPKWHLHTNNCHVYAIVTVTSIQHKLEWW